MSVWRKGMMRELTGFLLLSLFTAGLTAPLKGQVLYGSILGTVTDQSGSVIPGARIEATNTLTGQVLTATTNEGGLYSLTNVQPGIYDVAIGAPGFRTSTRTGVQVRINAVARVDAAMEVGQITEQVTVAAAAVQLQGDKTDVNVELAAKDISDTPLPRYRNYQSLINLVPGATPAQFQNANTDTPARALTTNINGTNRNNNVTRLDGAMNVFVWLPHHTLYVAPAETIETVNISTNNFDAEQGMAGGAAINVSTKSGTNEFHGTAFAYHENSVFRAKNFFFRDERRPKSLVTMPGFTLGGPIRQNKLFFFGGWEGMRERVNQNALFTLPTAVQRQGNFGGAPTLLYDPLSSGALDGSGRTPFAGNTIPLARQSAIMHTMQDLIPATNQPGDDTNFFNSATQEMNRDNYDLKINYNRTPNHTMWGKYSAMTANVIGQFGLGAAGGACLCEGGNGTGDTLVQLATYGTNWTIDPTTLVDFTAGWARLGQEVRGPDFGTNFGLDVLGIPGTNGPDPRQSGLPIFNIAGYSSLGNVNGWSPSFRNDQSYNLSTNVSMMRGSHEIRFGFEGIRHHLNHWQPELGAGPRGTFNFNQAVTSIPGAPTSQYNAWGAFLLGMPNSFGKSLQWEKMTAFENQIAWYVRDRWHVTPRLTVNLGLRYEMYPLMTRAGRGGIEDYDPDTNIVRFGGAGGNPRNLGVSTSRRLFAPRAGLAYRMTDSMVARAGYGITYNPMPLARPLRGFFPLTVAQDFNALNTFQFAGRIEDGIPDFGGPDLDLGQAPLPLPALMRFIEGDQLRRGYIQSWNLVVERELQPGTVASIGYVGTHTVRSFADRDGNAAEAGTGAAGRPLFERFERNTQTLFWNGSRGANYHSLQLSINRRVAGGLSLKGHYTWSKAINETDDDGWAGLTFNAPSQIGRNRAPAGFFQPHVFQLQYIYELPFGRDKAMATDGLPAMLLGGWQANGIWSMFSGPRFTVTADGGNLNAPGNTQTADQVAPEVVKVGSVDEFYDRSAFAPVNEARFGTSGRNSLQGPRAFNLDFSLFRDFPLSESLTLTFKAEAFNLTNTPFFNVPAANVSAENFMRITSTAGDERIMRFGLRLQF